MKLGIKVSLRPYSLKDLARANPPLAEVWFNISRANEYDGLFSELKKRKIETGLHYWGALPDGTMSNLAYPDTKVNKASLALVKQTIDIAAANGFAYVNIHPGQRAIVKVDFTKMDYPYVSAPEDLTDATNRFIEYAKELTLYAKNLGVVFTVETVSNRSPKTDWYNPESRLKPINIYDLPIESIEKAAALGIPIANDFVHTATHCVARDASTVWNFLLEKTKLLAPSTKLIHLGFLVPPFNGVDNHDMLDNPVFATNDAVPNKNQLQELLSLFKNRNDVWVITEPRESHAKNYFLAIKLLNKALL